MSKIAVIQSILNGNYRVGHDEIILRINRKYG
jgi:hypothetical protein